MNNPQPSWQGGSGEEKAHSSAQFTGPAADAAIHGCGSYSAGSWLFERLPLLDGIAPLLPGGPDKRPRVGNGWQSHPGVTIAQLQQSSPACICWQVGATADHIAIDIDGPKVITFLRAHGLDPLTADTWRIVRTSNADRLKLVFRVTPEQKAELAAGRKSVRIGGEEFAVFTGRGHQIVVLGNHHHKTKTANGTETWIHDDQYLWAGKQPADAQPLPDAWMEILRGVFCGNQPLLPRPAPSINGNGHRPTAAVVPAPPSGRWDDAAKARAALALLWVEDYADHDDWVRVGMALHSVGDPALLDDWDRWSAGDPSKYTPGECGKRWRSFNGAGGVSLGSLIHWAWGDGPKPWTTPQPQRPDADEWIPEGAPAPTGNGAIPPAAAIEDHEDANNATVEALQLNERLASGRAMFSIRHLLPQDLADATMVVMAAVQPDALSALMPLLGGFSGLHKLGTRVRPSASKTVPTNLFVCGLGVTGTAKTSFLENLVQAPAAEIRAEAAAENTRREKDWEEANHGKKKDEKASKPLPIFPHLTGYTPEAMDRQLMAMEARGLGMLVVREEASGLFGSLDQYKAAGRGGSGDAQLLENFDGSAKAEIRIGDNPRSYERCHLSVYTGAQPAIIRTLINGSDVTGKFARFLFVRLPHRALDLDADNPTPEAIAQFQEAMATLRRYAGAIYRQPPREYLMDPRARELFVAWFRRHQQRALLPGTPSTIGAMLNKAAAHALRVMGNLHLCRIAAEEIDPAAAIPVETVNNAMAIVDQLMAETQAFHEGGGDGLTELARRIHALSFNDQVAIDRAVVRGRSGNDIRAACTAKAFTAAIETLQQLGYGEISGRCYQATREMAA